MSNQRRAPQQERGERRLAELLDAAASVLAEFGYDAATMTAIAERAGASIGTLYQYFPNKETVVLALRRQYREKIQAMWSGLDVESTAGMSATEIAHSLVDTMNRFVEEHPAYFAIIDAPVKVTRSQEARNALRERIAAIFRSRNAKLSPEAAYRMANVALQVIKSMNALYKEASAKERVELVKEYRLILAGYLETRLS